MNNPIQVDVGICRVYLKGKTLSKLKYHIMFIDMIWK